MSARTGECEPARTHLHKSSQTSSTLVLDKPVPARMLRALSRGSSGATHPTDWTDHEVFRLCIDRLKHFPGQRFE